MSRITWAEAWPLVSQLFPGGADRPTRWPARLAPIHLARLQCSPAGKDYRTTVAHEAAIPPAVYGLNLEGSPQENEALFRAQHIRKGLPAVSADDFARWLALEGAEPSAHVRAWISAMDRAGASAPAVAVPEPVARPLQRQRHQEAEILRVLRELGHDPHALPRNTPGRAGPKAAAFGRLGWKKEERGVFDKAWERLRQARDIADA